MYIINKYIFFSSFTKLISLNVFRCASWFCDTKQHAIAQSSRCYWPFFQDLLHFNPRDLLRSKLKYYTFKYIGEQFLFYNYIIILLCKLQSYMYDITSRCGPPSNPLFFLASGACKWCTKITSLRCNWWTVCWEKKDHWSSNKYKLFKNETPWVLMCSCFLYDYYLEHVLTLLYLQYLYDCKNRFYM